MRIVTTFAVKLPMIWTLLLVMFAPYSQASQCQSQLSKLLGQAKVLVNANFDKEESCYKAAMLGRTQGRQGCYPPKAFILKDLMTPIANKAQQICTTICAKEGLTAECREITNQNYLVQWGINSTLKAIPQISR